MLAKLSLVLAAMATLTFNAAAAQCEVGPPQCCKNVEKSQEPEASQELKKLKIHPNSVTGLVGLHCSPIATVGTAASTTCNDHSVCCTNNSFHGQVALNCTRTNLNV